MGFYLQCNKCLKPILFFPKLLNKNLHTEEAAFTHYEQLSKKENPDILESFIFQS